MNKREFVCRAAIELNVAFAFSDWGFTDHDPIWRCAEKLWDARPQWMKDEEARLGLARQFANTIPDPFLQQAAAKDPIVRHHHDAPHPNVANPQPPFGAWPYGNPGASAPGC